MLSKSKYCSFVQCPRNLWLGKYHPEEAAEDAALELKLKEGNEVGDLAMQLFGEYTEVTAFTEDGRLDLSEMIRRTAELMQKGADVICEASFSYLGNYCAVDILRREAGGYAIYEVKSSTHAKDVYATDIAYQKFVLSRCGVNVSGTYLVCVNSSYVFDGELDLSGLFRVIDMATEVDRKYPFVEGNIAEACRVLTCEAEPDCDISERCNDPYSCVFFGHCTAHLPKPSVFDVYSMKFKKQLDYYRRGIVSFEDLANDKPTRKNKIRSLQVSHALADLPTHIDRDGIREYLDGLSFPLYFLDFETMRPIVPPFVGTRPYMQIPFQYSLHYIECEGGELRHKEFLAESGVDPRRAIAERLCEDIPRGACVLAYNKSFECSRIHELSDLFPDLCEHLRNIEGNIRDLIDPFQAGYYYNRAMGNSFSIKSVLPAIYPNDPSLDYHNLEGVHNGSEAMAIFPEIKNMPPEKAKEARRNLLKYCELDTFAMVKVWEELVRVTR